MKTSGSLIRSQRRICWSLLLLPCISLRSYQSSRIGFGESGKILSGEIALPLVTSALSYINSVLVRTADMATTLQGLLSGWVDSVWAALFPWKQVIAHRPLECDDPLPLVIEDITPAWLSKALNVTVETLRVQEVIHGSGSKVLIEVTYAPTRGRRHALPPAHLCVKGGFNPQLLAVLPDLFAVYRLEAEFYHHLAPRIPHLRLLPSYWCGVDQPRGRGRGQGLVVLADAGARGLGYTFGDPRRAWPVTRVREALAQLARLHAATWGGRVGTAAVTAAVGVREEGDDDDGSSSLLSLPWVPGEPEGMRAVVEGMMAPAAWAARFGDPAVRPPIPEVFWAHRDRVVRCLRALWASSSSSPSPVGGGGGVGGGDKMTCVVHGDTQVGNTFMDGEGRPGFLDWQCVHVNSAAQDVTYFMTGALEVEERRRHERELFGFYLDELLEAGGPRLEVEDVWDVSPPNYLSSSCHSFLFLLLTFPTIGISKVPNARLCLGTGRPHDAAEGGR